VAIYGSGVVIPGGAKGGSRGDMGIKCLWGMGGYRQASDAIIGHCRSP
jgi:hypothetical protein